MTGEAGWISSIHHSPFTIHHSSFLILKTCVLPTWWLLRGGCTRSHSEHGRETPLRQWYFVLRHGRVGRCQVCQTHVLQNILSSQLKLEGRSPRPIVVGAEITQRPGCISSVTAKVDAGWSSPVARQAHNLKVAGSNPAPATKSKPGRSTRRAFFVWCQSHSILRYQSSARVC